MIINSFVNCPFFLLVTAMAVCEIFTHLRLNKQEKRHVPLTNYEARFPRAISSPWELINRFSSLWGSHTHFHTPCHSICPPLDSHRPSCNLFHTGGTSGSPDMNPAFPVWTPPLPGITESSVGIDCWTLGAPLFFGGSLRSDCRTTSVKRRWALLVDRTRFRTFSLPGK